MQRTVARPFAKGVAVVLFGSVVITDGPAVAQSQPSKSSVQSAVRDARDAIQRTAPPARTATARSATAMPPRPEPDPCPPQARPACPK